MIHWKKLLFVWFFRRLFSIFWTKIFIQSQILNVKSDIVKFMDERGIVCLFLLDLSAAFDIVDHTS